LDPNFGSAASHARDAAVQRVAQKYIRPDHLAVVIVGDLKVIEPGIRALNLGPIKTMTVDEVFGPKP